MYGRYLQHNPESTRAEGGLGNVLCRRRRRRIEIPRRVGENDDHYRGSVWGIWPDSVGEEDRDSLDADAGETAEERGIAATTTCHRSSGAKVRPDHPVSILGRPCQRRWRTHARDQPPEQSSSVGMHQEVLPGALRPAESTVETQGSTVESGGDGGPTIRMHDVPPPPRPLYRLLRRTHHRLLLRVIGYRRERGTYRQLSYAQALKKTGCQSVEATIRQRRLLFAGAMARQPAGRLPKRLMDGKLVGGEDPGKGRPEQNWMDCLKDDFQAFGATDGSTVDNRLTFGVDRAVWTLAAKMDDGAPWHKGVLQGAEKFMTSWHKEEEEASRRRGPNGTLVILSPLHICR